MAVNVSTEVAYLLATSAEDRVYRRALRGLLPDGDVRPASSGGVRNNVGERFRDALRAFEERGWIVRDEETVVILDRMALYELANQ